MMRLSSKLIVGFGIISFLTIFLGAFAIYQLAHVQKSAIQLGNEWIPTVHALSDINTKVSDMRIRQNRHILAQTEAERAENEAEIEELLNAVHLHQRHYESIHLSSSTVSGEEKELYERFKQLFEEYLIRSHKEFYPLSRQDQDAKAKQFLTDLRGHFKKTSQILSKLVEINIQNAEQATHHAKNTYEESKILIGGVIVLVAIFSTVLASFLIRRLLLQIGGEPDHIAAITFRISQGDLSMDLGDGGTGIYASVKTMVANLRENAHRNFEQNWVKDGLNQLSKELSGDNSLSHLCYKAVSYLARYVDAGQGAVYIYCKETNDLELYGTYAFVERDELSNRYKIGQGVVGQVAFEKQPILLRNIQRRDVLITTATVSAPPLNTYTLPLLFEHSLQGVIELAAFEPFTTLKQELLKQACQIIATSLYSVRQSEETKKLLEIAEQATHEARERTATIELVNAQLEMQQQQLEEQAKTLQEKNTQLQKQQQQMSIQAEELKLRNASLLQTQHDLDQRAQELARSNQYKSEFLANMSHELRTPLNSIILLSKMLGQNKQANLTADDLKKASVIHEAGQELLRLINDILDLSKVEAGKMVLHFSQFSTESLVDEFRDIFDSVAKDKKLAFILTDNAQCQLYQDKQRISQIIRNFLSNAFKFTKQGSVTLKVTRQNGDKVAFSVTDNGIGIPKEEQNRIFEAFHQVDGSISREFGGTGLGLSIAASLAKLLKGEIYLTSEVGKGSEFTLVIPIAIGKVVMPTETARVASIPVEPLKTHLPEKHEDSPPLSEQEKVILVIEDDQVFAQYIAYLINEMAFKTLIATTGQEGIELAKKQRPLGIILDLGLPDLDGEDVLRIFKNSPELRSIPIEIVSAREKNKHFLDTGAFGFLQKPISADQINQAIDRLITFSKKTPKQVLLAEDNQLQQEVLRDLLNHREDTQITTVVGEADAINEIDKGHYDLAILDLTLQQGNGFKICTHIRQRYPELPIIIYTSRDLTEQEEILLHQSVQSIIQKGVDSEQQLLEQVTLFLHRLEEPSTALLRQITAPQQGTSLGDDLTNKKILVVDDDIKNVFVLASSLESCGAEVIDAQDGQSALEVLRNQTVDLVLMDIMMPGMNGFEAIRAMRADDQLKHLPVIAVTAKALLGDREKCLAVGANDYLAKPLNYEDLIKKVKYWSESSVSAPKQTDTQSVTQ